jgi:O-antigen/teichoic acid export membrane protein
MTVLIDKINRFRFSLTKKWRNRGFSRNVAVMAVGTVLGQAVAALATPILTRLYTPEALGILSVVTSLALIIAVVANWRYEYAIMLPDKDEEAVQLLRLSSLLSVLMASLAFVVVGLFRHQIAQLLDVAGFAQWLWVVPLVVLLRGLYQAGSYWLARRKQFVRLAIAGVSRSMVSIGSQIGAALLTSLGPVGLLIGTVAGETVATGILGADIRKNYHRLFPDSTFWASVGSNIRKFRNFPLYTAPYSFLGIFSKRALFLLLGVYATTSEVGLFAVARKFTHLPASLTAAAIKQVFFQKAATELGSGNLERLVVRILKLQVIVTTPVLVFFLFNARWISGIIFGDAWNAVGTYATWLVLPAFLLLFTWWGDRIYDVVGRQRLALLMESIYDIVSVGLFGLLLVRLRSVEWATGVFSGVTAVYYVVWLTVTFRVAGFSQKVLWRIGMILLGLVSTAGAVHWAVAMLFPRVGAAAIYLVLMVLYYGFLGIRYRHYWK